MARRGIAVAAVAAALVLGVTAPGAGAQTLRAEAAGIDPGDFVRFVTNPLLPFPPGTVLTYRGVDTGEAIHERVTVRHRTKRILGVATTVVHDVIRHLGRLLEETEDWYAQDKHGNVWYFGEDTRTYENGHVSTEGSWEAGVHGAMPGVVMEADPHAPDAYRQELYRGHAEDMAWVLRRGGDLRVPFGRVDHILLTMEWTRLEPRISRRRPTPAASGSSGRPRCRARGRRSSWSR